MCRYLLFVIVLSLTIHYSNIIWDRRKPSRWLRRSVSAWRKLGQFVQAGEGSHHQRFCLLFKSVISFFRALGIHPSTGNYSVHRIVHGRQHRHNFWELGWGKGMRPIKHTFATGTADQGNRYASGRQLGWV